MVDSLSNKRKVLNRIRTLIISVYARVVLSVINNQNLISFGVTKDVQ